MRFIHDNQIPVGYLQLLLKRLVAGELIKAGNAVIRFSKYVAADCGLYAVVRENIKSEIELAV